MRVKDFLELFDFQEGWRSKERIAEILCLKPEEAEDIIKFTEQEGITFEPIKNEVRLKGENLSLEQTEKLSNFLEMFSPRYDCFDGNLYNKKGEPVGIDVDRVSNFLIRKFIFKTIFGNKSIKVFVYEGGIYREVGEGFLKTEAEKIVGRRCSNHLANEILGKITRKTSVRREDFFVTPLNLIPFQNGVFDINEKVLKPYKPEYNFRHKLRASYVRGMKCPEFKKFLLKILYHEDVRLIQELLGFVLYRRYFLKKGFIFVGGRDTGKTTLINIFVGLLGLENTAGISLQRISQNDKFAIASLHEKHLNFYDDLSFKDLNDGGGFKIATGGGYVTAEYKFGDSFQFQNFAKLLFAANKIPIIKDVDDDAYYSRWIPLQFDNPIPESEQDPRLPERILEKESTGIINWGLEGLFRLLKKNKFSFNKTPEEVKAIMCRSGNPLWAFVEDVLQQEEGKRITKEQMFEIYRIYAQENKLTPLTKEQLGRQLGKVAHFIVDKRDKERFWENVALKSNWKDKPEIVKILDTLDTSQKSIRDEEKEIKEGILTEYIIFPDVSKVSNKSIEKEKDLKQQQAELLGYNSYEEMQEALKNDS